MFYSILYPNKETADSAVYTSTECLTDLGLTSVFDYIFKSKIAYQVEPFYFTTLTDPGSVKYRQAVLQDLENPVFNGAVTGFSALIYAQDAALKSVRNELESNERWRNNYLTKGQLLQAAENYCAAIDGFSQQLDKLDFKSEGLSSFRDYLAAYVKSDAFAGLISHAKRIRAGLSEVEYSMYIKDWTIRVRKYDGEPDYSNDIEGLFDKFRIGDGEKTFRKLSEDPVDIKIETKVLELVAGIYKELFSDLDNFCVKYYGFVDEPLYRFSREIQFYLAWLELIAPLREYGLPFCYPELAVAQDDVFSREGFDVALAYKRRGDGIVTNDFELTSPEHMIVLTGPNQGGKTTFTRAFGQMHYLAALGLSVPGRSASMFLFDKILTHFGREEDLNAQSGQLKSDLRRLKAIFDTATDKSVVLINEIFSSTTISDAVLLGKKMIDGLIRLNCHGIVVTFLDELAVSDPAIVSMMSLVNPDEPGKRTFKIVRKPPDGLAYAIYIASRHGLTYDQLHERLIGGEAAV
ncbi:MAG: hypothetical protein LBS90_08765 [Oscillospiraceae bacterium]|jgi:hypothetical protein|nr:hypothetical protein [Oscillospiraceae bacterium]